MPDMVGIVALETPPAMARGLDDPVMAMDIEHFDHARHRTQQAKHGAERHQGGNEAQSHGGVFTHFRDQLITHLVSVPGFAVRPAVPNGGLHDRRHDDGTPRSR